MAETVVEKKGGCQIIKESASEYRLVKPGGLTLRCTSEAYAREEMEKFLKRQEGHGFKNSAFQTGAMRAQNAIQNMAARAGVRVGNAESGIEGNLPPCSHCYSRAYALMKKHGANLDLIKALDKGDEEKIKGILLREYRGDDLTETGKNSKKDGNW
jgi:hypothetical protein